jgi:hypothetical protein
MDPLVKKILNSLKCPQCGAGIDIYTKISSCFNYACAADNLHYQVHLATDNGLDYPHNLPIHPVITAESVVMFEAKHKYVINQSNASILGTVDETNIEMFNIDPERRVIEDKKKRKLWKSFQYDKKLFDFAHTNKEKILNRIKTILVFQ